MKKRRGLIDDEAFRENLDPIVTLVEGGDNWDYCVKIFLEELELKNLAYHTRRWHKENLHYVQKTLLKLHLSNKLTSISEKDIKKCILYWRRDCNLSPTTINHRIRSMKQLYSFLASEGIVDYIPLKKVEKLKGPRLIIRPFDEDELKRLFLQPDKSTFVGYRDYTIMLVLLDTGVRLIELENMVMGNIDLSNNKILVFGKGAKEREVMFQGITRQYLQRYIKLRGILEHEYLWI